jgi:hypothetical protein
MSTLPVYSARLKSSLPPGDSAVTSADAAMQQRVVAYFAKLPVESLRKLRVEVRDTVVTLLGQVANNYERQLAHHYARRVPGVVALVDNIAVDEPPPPELGPVGRMGARVGAVRGAAAATLHGLLPQSQIIESRQRARHGRSQATSLTRRKLVTHPLAFVGVTVGFVLIVITAALSGQSGPQGVDRLATYPVKGSVVIGKEPPQGAFVVFHPVSGSATGPFPAGYVTKFGGYSLTTYELGDGAPAGDYRVTIEWRQPPGHKAKPLSDKLGSPKTTTLHARVTTGGNVVSQFKL